MNAYKDVLHTYKNGNYLVKIFKDGSKVRFTLDDYYNPSFPESIDIKITNYCDNNCPMCHEKSSVNGNHGNLDALFLKTLTKGTELAIGGGNPFAHPELEKFLLNMKKQGVICNITINQNHFIKYKDNIIKLIENKLIYGLGISIIDETNLKEIIDFSLNYTNSVIHLIVGLIKEKLLEKLYDKNLKVLFLGYKQFGRGISYYSNQIKNNISYLNDNIINISKHFKVVSFDNLAIEQLKMNEKISDEDYQKYYMGDDGSFTMYIDLVEKTYAVSSISKDRFKIKDNIEEMFKDIAK